MYIIKLDAIDSTNSYLKTISLKKMPKDFTVVVAEEQTNGRGQMGTQWQAEASKNLTFSVFKDVSFLKVSHQFCISMAVALGLSKALKELQIPKIKIKWPNDILSENKKIAGILIENVIKNNTLEGSIIGMGLNVNQKFFDDLPNASSLHLITGIVYSKDEVLHNILKHIEHYLKRLESGDLNLLKKEYEAELFRIKKPSTFKTPTNQIFSGFIEGITDDGKLKLLLEDDVHMAYDLKEVELLY
ncbi:biotin--[acetyl-CoA-carboxylase] ligase [Winogradskyella jejuensis]|uniref:BirA family transcriptional regulator, biotin operon repressor / biotin-[acetyl-CoA-carboxylase] ligase n=1 Tax=Winogradskyella jejuensis TaxID=1089305 RepID=A0A1M5RT43_9FLAO|nr:biotin--[acetyl-CoA-carboxylase] ligase [Winogradskyella jejuensis]SHH29457.1 BirA family transcriptional regulator, biotin operon repressor / biotin-[acetyl-CoA-carboxylase] ligase [Winogradskyella jejuensis]